MDCVTTTGTITITSDAQKADCITGGMDPVCVTGGGLNYSNAHEPIPATYNYKTCNDKGCDCSLEEHQPAIIHCNVCATDGVQFIPSAATTSGDPSYTCECEDGLDWRFNGSTSYQIIVPEKKPASCFIIWGHDLCDTGAEITLYADGVQIQPNSHDGGSAIIEPQCSHCCWQDDQCKAVAIYFDCEFATDWRAEIVTTGDHIIESAGFYQCLTENLCIWGEEDLKNPFSASRYETQSKQLGCGWAPPTLKPRMITYEHPVYDMSEQFVDHELQQVLYWMQRHRWYWAQSINRRNCDLAQGRLIEFDGTTWSNCFQDGVLEMELNMHSGVK